MSVLSEQSTRSIRRVYRKFDYVIEERLVTDLLDTIDHLRAGIASQEQENKEQ